MPLTQKELSFCEILFDYNVYVEIIGRLDSFLTALPRQR